MINIINTLPFYYTDKELMTLLKSITVLVDTREQKNLHITKYFDSKTISYKSKKLNYGDYSFYLPANVELGIARDMYFNNDISIERKANLEELSNCFTHDRSRFESELIRSYNSNLILLIEDSKYQDIINNNYRTNYNNKSFIASLMAFKYRYKIDITFISQKYSGNYIYYNFYYYLREHLKS